MPAPPWLITGVIALSGLAASLNQTLVIPLLPGFPRALGITGDDAGWLITVTLMIGAVSVPVMSRLADMYGKRRALLTSLILLTVGSVISAFGADFVTLLIGRGFSGFGMTLIPIGISVLRDVLPSNRLGTAVALQSATLSIGGAIGMPLAGVLNDTLGWSSVFWVTAGVTAALVIATIVFVPTTPIRTGG
ncbi:MFS transporter [Microbacterium soli]|uniref:MFS transporter n=1 Tax=Microbacterium soli TaxID=446075 RepID=UPI0031DD229C